MSVANGAGEDVWAAVLRRVKNQADASRLACVSRATAAAFRTSPQFRKGARICPASGRVHPPLDGDAGFDVVMEPGVALSDAVVACPEGGCVLLPAGACAWPDIAILKSVHVFGRPSTVVHSSIAFSSTSGTIDGVRFGERAAGLPSVKANGGSLRVQGCSFACAANQACLHLQNFDRVVVEKCALRKGCFGICVDRGKSLLLLDNTISGMARHGIGFGSDRGLVVTMGGNTIENNVHGIHFSGDTRIERVEGRPDVFNNNEGGDFVGNGRLFHALLAAHAARIDQYRATYAAMAARTLQYATAAVQPAKCFRQIQPNSPRSWAHLATAAVPSGSTVLIAPGVYRVIHHFTKDLTFFGNGDVTLFTDRHVDIHISARVTFVGIRFFHECLPTCFAGMPKFSTFKVLDGGHLTLQGCTVESMHTCIHVQARSLTSLLASDVGDVVLDAGSGASTAMGSTLKSIEVGAGGARLRISDSVVTDGIVAREGSSVSASNTAASFLRPPGPAGQARHVLVDGHRML